MKNLATLMFYIVSSGGTKGIERGRGVVGVGKLRKGVGCIFDE